ncbi:hypothetical protein [Nannocystis pusilla]|uniref:hypothetical protein n=1 Tax=Nannocystis pusilla TaxID=889268 RepID=UPI003B7916FE
MTAGRAEAVRLGKSDWVAEIDARIASLPQVWSDAAVVRALSDLVARESAAIGEPIDSPVRAGPAELAQAGELQWRSGDQVGARRSWSRARTLLRERGGAVDVVAVETWFTSRVLWRGDRLALVRRYTPALDYGAGHAGALDLVAAESGAPVLRRLRFTHPVEVAAFSDDGRTLARDEAGALVFQDMSSGAVVRRIEPQSGEQVHALAVAGSGEAMRVLAAHGREIVLWDAAGAPLQRFGLAGTTPTIMRVYRAGQGTRHDNILRDSPTWPVSRADGRRLADRHRRLGRQGAAVRPRQGQAARARVRLEVRRTPAHGRQPRPQQPAGAALQLRRRAAGRSARTRRHPGLGRAHRGDARARAGGLRREGGAALRQPLRRARRAAARGHRRGARAAGALRPRPCRPTRPSR